MPDAVRHVPRGASLLLPRSELGLFRAALAVVALAVADDAFIHSEPGVAATDHLASGQVPLALAALLIGVAPRLTALARGWLAIFAGALAIVGGATDGVRDVIVDRVSGDDVTAVPAGGAGVMLVALGVATVWRTRRTTGPVAAVSRAAQGSASRSSPSDCSSSCPPASRSSPPTRHARRRRRPTSDGRSATCG